MSRKNEDRAAIAVIPPGSRQSTFLFFTFSQRPFGNFVLYLPIILASFAKKICHAAYSSQSKETITIPCITIDKYGSLGKIDRIVNSCLGTHWSFGLDVYPGNVREMVCLFLPVFRALEFSPV